jgi:hypothetical protein
VPGRPAGPTRRATGSCAVGLELPSGRSMLHRSTSPGADAIRTGLTVVLLSAALSLSLAASARAQDRWRADFENGAAMATTMCGSRATRARCSR